MQSPRIGRSRYGLERTGTNIGATAPRLLRRQEDVAVGSSTGVSCFRFLIFSTWSLALIIVGVTLGKQIQFSWISSSDSSIGGPRGKPWIVSDGSTPGQGTVLFVDPHNHHGENAGGDELGLEGAGGHASSHSKELHSEPVDSKSSSQKSSKDHISTLNQKGARRKASTKPTKNAPSLDHGSVDNHSAATSASSKTTSTSEVPRTNEASSNIGKRRFWPVQNTHVPTDEELEDTAFVTMATGDESGRHAVALIQSLRDSNSRIPNVLVLLVRGGGGSSDCKDPAKRKEKGRDNVLCDGLDTFADEIVSQVYLDAFDRLGAHYEIFDPLPSTPYTAGIPGGRSIAWGMALNKLHVFGLTQFKKIVWFDSDTLIFNNIDHLVLKQDFTAAFTNDCGNRNADAKMSGGLWVFTPSQAYVEKISNLINGPVPGTENDGWTFGDMQVVLYLFGKITEKSPYREWPFSRDMRQGTVPGLRSLPAYADMTDDAIAVELLQGGRRGKELTEPGVQPNDLAEAQAAGDVVWHMLDPRYDGLIGNCENLPERDLGEHYYSGHFTCLPVVPPVHKPGRYENEEEFMSHVRTRMKGCMRYYFLRWYDCFSRAVQARLPEPLYDGPEVSIVDAEADLEVDANRKEAFDIAVAEEKRRNEANALMNS
jgi:hypothetical protein